MVKIAYRQLASPQVHKLRPHELEILNTAQKEQIEFQGFKIQTYYWPGGPKTVLLVHGWEGQAGNFSDIIERFQQENYSIYAFDGPSHGFSSKGSTTFFEFSDLVAQLIQKWDIRQVVSHSFGGVATTLALYRHLDLELELDRYVLLTTPDKFMERIEEVSAQVGITDRVKEKLVQRLQKEVDEPLESFNVSDFVKVIRVKEALIIHDKDDRVIPIARSRNVHKNWPQSRFVTVENTGHFRILRTPSVIEETLNFMENPA